MGYRRSNTVLCAAILIALVACAQVVGDAALMERAWQHALDLADANKPQRRMMRRPETTITREAAYGCPLVDCRYCGLTVWLWKQNARGKFVPDVFVRVWIKPEEEKLLYRALVHEYLHYTLGWVQGRFASEAEVLRVWEGYCPAS